MSWESNVRKVTPYVGGEQPRQGKVIKLNTNECPYPPAPGVLRAIKELDGGIMRLYPDMKATKLVEALSEFYHVDEEQIFVGVGSDDVLAMSFLTFFNSDKPILFPDITYSFYDVWAELFRIPYKTCALDENFRIRRQDYLMENGGVILPNPNAPTGEEEPVAGLEEIIAANPDVVVIIDEAYVDFGAESVLPLIDKYDNLLVVQTCSKSRAMAGCRIGYAFGSKKLIGYLKDVKYSFNTYTMNTPSIEIGAEAVRDGAYFKETVEKIIKTREWSKKKLAELGFLFTDSKSNFIFTTHPEVQAKELFNALRENNIYVRYWDKPRINNHLRITVGTDEQMETLIDFLDKYLKEKKYND